LLLLAYGIARLIQFVFSEVRNSLYESIVSHLFNCFYVIE